MIEIPTVLVLGAGASAPFGFPTGQDLKTEICEATLVSGLKQIVSQIGFTDEQIKTFRLAIQNSGRSSVDAFLEYRDEFIDIGKAVIAVALLPKENTIGLFKTRTLTRRNLPERKEGNWYDLLFGALCDGTSFDDVDKNRLSIITFNYDRSLEQYLFTALKNSYGKTDEECAEKLSKIPIVHVHGSLGRLEWQPAIDEDPSVPYDCNPHKTPESVRHAARSLKIIPEATTETPEFIQARDMINTTSRLLFLGFGYHPINMKRLVPPLVRIPQKLKGTSYGLSFERKKSVERWNALLSESGGSLIEKDVHTFLYNHISLSGSE